MAYIVRNMIEVTITALRLGWTTQREAAVRDTDIVITISHTSLKAWGMRNSKIAVRRILANLLLC